MSDTEFERVLNTARIVFSLLKRSETPPEPPAYEAVFGAVAPDAVPDDEALRDLIMARIAAEADRRERGLLLGADLGEGLAAIGQTLETASATHSAYAGVLADAEGKVAAAPTPPALRAVLARLIEDTTRVQRANKALASRVTEAARQIEGVQIKIAQTRRDASVDALTQIGNRRHFDALAPQALTAARTAGAPLSLILLDVDHFRRFNETYGHQIGDAVLRVIARVLAGLRTGADVIARIGGEEFAMLLPGSDLDAAKDFSERVRQGLAQQVLAGCSDARDMERITASYGLAELRQSDSVFSLMERADRCLYAAKQAGRNRIMADCDAGMAEGGGPATAPAASDDDSQSLLDLLAAIN